MVVAALEVLLTLVQLLVGVLFLRVVAENGLVDHGVENLLLPAVVLAAVALELAALLVLADEVAGLPRLAHLEGIVLEEVGLAAEALPVVRVDALRLVVLGVVGAPLRLEVEHVELLVARHLVDQRRLDVLVAVREGAELLVLALLQRLRAELGLVLLDVVQAFHLVVRVGAVLVAAALQGAEVQPVVHLSAAAPPVQLPVVLRALLRVVRLLVRALLHLEHLQVQVLPARTVRVEKRHVLVAVRGARLAALLALAVLLRARLVLFAVVVALGRLLEDLVQLALERLELGFLLLLDAVDLLEVGRRLDLVHHVRLLLIDDDGERARRFLNQVVHQLNQLVDVGDVDGGQPRLQQLGGARVRGVGGGVLLLGLRRIISGLGAGLLLLSELAGGLALGLQRPE